MSDEKIESEKKTESGSAIFMSDEKIENKKKSKSKKGFAIFVICFFMIIFIGIAVGSGIILFDEPITSEEADSAIRNEYLSVINYISPENEKFAQTAAKGFEVKIINIERISVRKYNVSCVLSYYDISEKFGPSDSGEKIVGSDKTAVKKITNCRKIEFKTNVMITEGKSCSAVFTQE